MERLIIFTRYPEPGKAKTRLIPALGAEAAARLHRQLAEHTLAQSDSLQTQRSVAVEVWFAGGDLIQMQTWLGQRHYQAQGHGDLGDRLTRAFQTAVHAKSTATVIIGTDCPDLSAAILNIAFEQLQQVDLVLGPATDGGYYLIGLRRTVPELFQEIAWSTSSVLQQTVTIAEKLQLTIAYLPTLSDIDRPEDLKLLENRESSY